MKRVFFAFIVLVLAFSMSFSSLAVTFASVDDSIKTADVDADGKVTLRDAAIFKRFLAGWTDYKDENDGITFPGKSPYIKGYSPDTEVDFQGREFVFAVKTELQSGLTKVELAGVTGTNKVTGNSATTGVFNLDNIEYKSTNFLANLNRQSKEMRDYIEGHYNCKIKVVPFTYWAGRYGSNTNSAGTKYNSIYLEMKNALLSGEHKFDFCVDLVANGGAYITADLFADLNSLDNFDNNASYFNQNLMDELTVFGKNYYAFGAGDTSAFRNAGVILAHFDNIPKYEPEGDNWDVKQLVDNNIWTITKFYDIVQNANITDDTGIIHDDSQQLAFCLYSGVGGKYVTKDNVNGFKFAEDLSKDSVLTNKTFADPFKGLYTGANGSGVKYYSKTTDANFKGFHFTSVGRAANEFDGKGTDMVILPMPLMNNHRDYISTVYFRKTTATAITSSSFDCAPDARYFGFENGAEMNAFLLSAMFDKAEELDLKCALIDDFFTQHSKKDTPYMSAQHKEFNRRVLNTVYDSMKLNASQYVDVSGANSLINEAFHDFNGNVESLCKNYYSINKKNHIAVETHENYDFADECQFYCALDLAMNYLKNK